MNINDLVRVKGYNDEIDNMTGIVKKVEGRHVTYPYYVSIFGKENDGLFLFSMEEVEKICPLNRH